MSQEIVWLSFLAFTVFGLILLYHTQATKKVPRDYSRELWLTIGRYGLTDKVDLKEWIDFGNIVSITLFRVIEKEIDRELPLPAPFVDDIRKLVEYHYGPHAEFKTDKGKTREEIHAEIKAWEGHCKLAWTAYD